MRKKLRQVSLLVVFTLVISYFSLTAGYEQEQSEAVLVTDIYFDNLMVNEGNEDTVTSGGSVSYTCTSIREAGEKLREALKDRKGKITIKMSKEVMEKNPDYADVCDQICDIALEHTGVGDEGDYLHWSMISLAPGYLNNTYYFTVKYVSDASMEKKTTEAIKKIEKKLSIKGSDSTFEKIQTIYDYLARHIDFDYEYKKHGSLPLSAYDAAVKGTAVCQGYATLFYRILLDYGIDNRILVSYSHAWNLVGIEGKYYECDLTWDSEGVQKGSAYEFLLTASRGVERDEDHTWNKSEMDGGAEKLPRATSDYIAQSSAVPSLKVAKKSKSAVLKWSAVKNVQGYRIYRKSGNGNWKMIAVTAKTTYTDKNLGKGTYSYRVQPYYMILKGSYSKSKKIVY